MGKTEPETSKKKILEILRFEVSSDQVAYKRITHQVRELILSKSLHTGDRLPPLMDLAKLWKTNYYTVQTSLTPLVNEGLLIRRQRTGTFVAENTRQIKAVGIYFGGNFWRVKHAAFYQTLYAALCDFFERKEIAVHLFMDSRPRELQGTPFEPLVKAIERSEVSAVIGSMLTTEEALWVEQLPVPVSFIASGGNKSNLVVDIGMGDFLSSSMKRLKQRGCRSVALITGEWLADVDLFLHQANESGLKSRKEWVLKRDTWPEEFEEFGFEAFAKIWSGSEKPDSLIIHPDNIARGVIMAILQKGVRVPDELKLVMHCNEEVYFYCPMPADWQVVSIARIVDTVWKHLRSQADGETVCRLEVGLSLRPNSSHLQPTLRKWK